MAQIRVAREEWLGTCSRSAQKPASTSGCSFWHSENMTYVESDLHICSEMQMLILNVLKKVIFQSLD